MFRTFVALFAALFMAGCSTLPPAPSQAAQPDYKYIIGPGDVLNIVVWRNPELSAAVPVRPDGRITTPLVEDMVAQGKNPSDLAREVETALKKYLQDPVVTVVVSGFGGGNSEQVRVLGQAVKPATLPYRQNMTLLDVMIAVGGLTDFAAGNRAVLIRAAENNKAYNVRLADLIKRGDVAANAQVLPGDVIIIPESRF
ncbi:MAG: sugar ABC transporter substrate-binding protein [Burkholderiales bacterium]|nr:MAG: sugar ABC transporter substrate-binding protein [Burkholderiales bacterium]